MPTLPQLLPDSHFLTNCMPKTVHCPHFHNVVATVTAKAVLLNDTVAVQFLLTAVSFYLELVKE